MTKKILFLLTALLTWTTGAWAFEGEGTQDSPYLIKSIEDMTALANSVNTKNSDGTWNTYAGKFFRLENDLVYDKTVGNNFTTIANRSIYNIANNEQVFSGTFDGNYHSISGLNLSTQSNGHLVGVFGWVENGTVKNLTVKDSHFELGKWYNGAIVAYCRSSVVENCHVTTDVTLHGTDTNSFGDTGGVVGEMYKSKSSNPLVKGCTSAAKITFDEIYVNPSTHRGLKPTIGGVVGERSMGDIQYCFYYGNDGDLYCSHGHTEYMGIIVGETQTTTEFSSENYFLKGIDTHLRGVGGNPHVTSSGASEYTPQTGTAVNKVTFANEGIQMSGEPVVTFEQGISFLQQGFIFDGNLFLGNGQSVTLTFDETTAIGFVFGGFAITEGDENVLDGSTITMGENAITVDVILTEADWEEEYAGTEEDPYIIATTGQMDQLAARVNNGKEYAGNYFRLVNDLVYGDGTGQGEPNYTPVGYISGSSINVFRGSFDGEGHTISGIVINSTNNHVGLFGYTQEGTLKNITLSASTISGKGQVGGIVGSLHNGAVENCHVTESVTIQPSVSSPMNLGGIVGWTYGPIDGCTSAAQVVGNGSCLGGIVGRCTSAITISNCLYLGPVIEGNKEVGAIVGYCVDDCTLSGNYYTTDAFWGLGSSNNYEGTDVEGQAERVFAYDELQEEMGSVTKTYGYEGLTIYENGMAYNDVFYGKTPDLILADNADNTAMIARYAGKEVNVILKDRILYKDGSWNTLCLPFYVNDYETPFFEGAEFMMITTASYDSSTKTLSLNFNNVASVPAGEPFLVRWPASDDNIVEPRFEKIKFGRKNNTYEPIVYYAGSSYPIQQDKAVITFQGSYAPYSFTANDKTKLYMGADNTLYYPSADFTMGAQRCYFTLLGGLTAGDLDANVQHFTLSFDGDSTTGISGLGTADGKTTGPIYDLQGRRLDATRLPKGIYIQDGRKVVKK